MDAVLVLNERCGTLQGAGGAVSPDAVRREFETHGLTLTLRLVAPGEFERAIRSAAESRPETLFVGGGDGSVSTAARCLVGTDVALGVVPLGTLNHFARDLGFDPDWKRAAPALARAVPRLVDVGEVNGHVFVNNCSVGAYPQAVLRRDAIRSRGLHKWLAMSLAVFAEFWRLRRIRFELELPDQRISLRSPFVLISNNRYSGHVLSQRMRPRLDEGQLWIYTTRAKARFQLVRLAWQSLVRRIDAADALETHAAPAATLRTRASRVPVGVDGEVLDLPSPLRLQLRPRALRVLAPPPSTP